MSSIRRSPRSYRRKSPYKTKSPRRNTKSPSKNRTPASPESGDKGQMKNWLNALKGLKQKSRYEYRHPYEALMRTVPDTIHNLLVVVHGLDVNEINFSHEVKEYIKIFKPDYLYAPIFKQEKAGGMQHIFNQNFGEFLQFVRPKLHYTSNITIVGISNGGRYALLLANHLQNFPCRQIKVFTLASPLKGTQLVAKLPKTILVKNLGKQLYEELLPNSTYSLNMEKLRQSLKPKVRVYSVAGGNDLIVNPPQNAYFEGDQHFVLNGVDHGHIFGHSKTLQWLKRKQKQL